MAVTFEELLQRLAAKYDEITLVEILDLRSEDIVRAFQDKIEVKQEELRKGLDEDGEFSHQDHQTDEA